MSDRGNVVAISDSGAFTYAELYRDFNFEVAASINFTLSGPAIQPLKTYQITWYSYSTFDQDDATTLFGPTLGSNTSGSIGSVTHTATPQPTANGQYSFTGFWSSTDNSFEITATRTSGSGLNAINGFEIVPEPSTLTLLALAACAMLRRRTSRK